MKPRNPITLSLTAVPVASAASAAKKNATPARTPILSSSVAAFRSSAISTEQRKRSQRVLLRVRANVHVALKGKQTTLETTTVSVHPEGALVVMKQSLPAETRLILEHHATKEKVGCRVARAKEMPEGFHVFVEFDSPAPDFWKINFPKADWHPEEL